jgi:hypothetical protein
MIDSSVKKIQELLTKFNVSVIAAVEGKAAELAPER